MPEESRQNLTGADRGSCYNQEEWVEGFLDDKGAFYSGSESDDRDNDDENYNENMEAVVRRCSSKYVFLKISQVSQERTCVRVSFNKIVGPKLPCNFIKNRLQHRCFPVKFTNFLRTPFFTEHLRWLPLKIMNSSIYLKVLPIVAKK